MPDGVAPGVLGMTATIVAAFVAKNQLGAEALPSLINAVHRALATAGEVEVKAEIQAPAVPIRKSVFPEYIVCLEDGKKLKMLKRHLKTSYDLTPDAYRAKWNLPHDYPMVAPSYASLRSTLAKKIGLGRKAGPVAPPVTVLPARRKRQG